MRTPHAPSTLTAPQPYAQPIGRPIDRSIDRPIGAEFHVHNGVAGRTLTGAHPLPPAGAGAPSKRPLTGSPAYAHDADRPPVRCPADRASGRGRPSAYRRFPAHPTVRAEGRHETLALITEGAERGVVIARVLGYAGRRSRAERRRPVTAPVPVRAWGMR